MTDYKDDNFWLMKGDCLERMKEIPDGSVDVLISDIPYGIDFSTWDVTHKNSNSSLLGASPSQNKSAVFKKRGKPKNGWCKEDRQRTQEYQDFCEAFLVEAYRVTKAASPIILMSGRQNQHRCTVAGENAGLIFKDVFYWDKQRAPFRAQSVTKVLERRGESLDLEGDFRLGSMSPQIEPILWLFKPYDIGSTITDRFLDDGVGCFNSDFQKSNVISISSKVMDKKHETQKPVELFEHIINIFSKQSHIILDPFMGSGTTGVACKNLNRRFIGIEMDDKYFDICLDRIFGDS